MKFLASIREKLLNDPAIAGLVSGRVYAVDMMPDGTPYPFVNFHSPTGETDQTLTEICAESHALVWVHMWSERGDQCGELVEAVFDCLANMRETIGDIKFTQFMHEQREGPKFDRQARVYGAIHEFSVRYREVTP